MDFPNEQELAAMKKLMDGEPGASKNDVVSGMKKAGVVNLYELIVWGLRTGIIQDPPLPSDIKNRMERAGTYEGYPTWLRVLAATIAGYNDSEIQNEAGVSKDSLAFYRKTIADKFGIGDSRARLIRFGFQLLNPITANPSMKAVKPPPEEPKPEPPPPTQPNIVAVPEKPKQPSTGIASVVIADDSPLAIRGITDFLTKLGYEVVGTASDGVDAVSEVAELKPDILIIEVAMPKKNGITVARYLRDRFPNTKIVMYTGYKDKKYLHAALAVGADAYVMKTSQAPELRAALKRVMNGEMYVDKELRKELMKLRPSGDRTPFETLTEQQLLVLQLIAESYNTKSIADIMKLSPKTVEYHRAELMNALNIWDVAGLVRYALKHGITRMNERKK